MNLYEILGVNKNATNQEIREAYRKKVLEYHPDRNKTLSKEETSKKFNEVQKAFDILNDDTKRARYNNELENPQQFQQSNQNYTNYDHNDFSQNFYQDYNNSAQGNFFEINDGDFSDILNDLFNFRSKKTQKNIDYGNIYKEITLSFFEQFDTNKILKYERVGKNNNKENVSIDFKDLQDTIMNIKNLERISINGGGNYNFNYSRFGDLILTIKIINETKFYSRDGLNIYLKIPINFIEAILGTTKVIYTLKGKYTLNIPAGIKNGQNIILKNFGATSGYKVGHHINVIYIQDDMRLSVDQQEILKKIILRNDQISKNEKDFYTEINNIIENKK